MWSQAPEDVLLQIMDFLDLPALSRCDQVSTWWHYISRRDVVWKRMLLRDFLVNGDPGLPPGGKTWRSEYRRLHWKTPTVESEELTDHSEGVTCADFSPDGRFLATCGKDGMVCIFNLSYPCTLKHKTDLYLFGLSEALYCSFNASGTKLLVSGARDTAVIGGTVSSGDIFILGVEGPSMKILSRITNKPVDALGCWFGDRYVISSEVEQLSHSVSASLLWMNKVREGSEEGNDHTLACMRSLYKLYNPPAKFFCSRMIVYESWARNKEAKKTVMTVDEQLARQLTFLDHRAFEFKELSSENLLSCEDYFVHTRDYFPLKELAFQAASQEQWSYVEDEAELLLDSGEEFDSDSNTSEWEYFDEENVIESEPEKPEFVQVDTGVEVINEREKVLVLATGVAGALWPHQLAFKNMSNVRFRQHMDIGKPIQERIKERKRKQKQRRREERMGVAEEEYDAIDWTDFPSVYQNFSPISSILELRADILGMEVTKDSSFLYVNVRPWPTEGAKNKYAKRSLHCLVIDLVGQTLVGKLDLGLCSTLPTPIMAPCVTKNLFGTGCGGRSGGLWDRHFGIPLATYFHDAGVTSVAIDPTVEQTAASVGLDGTILIWRSRECMSRSNKIS